MLETYTQLKGQFLKSQIFSVWNLLSSLNPSFPIAYHQPIHHPSNIPQSRLQSKSEDPAEEEHWLLSVQDSWKTSSTSLLVLSLLFILLLLLLGMAAVKIAKHLFRQFSYFKCLSQNTLNTFKTLKKIKAFDLQSWCKNQLSGFAGGGKKVQMGAVVLSREKCFRSTGRRIVLRNQWLMYKWRQEAGEI